MFSQNISLPKTLNPPVSPRQWKLSNPLHKTINPTRPPQNPRPFSIQSFFQSTKLPIPGQNHTHRQSVRSFAGRRKRPFPERIEGTEELMRKAKRSARRKAKKYAESFFYRLKNPNSNYPNNFSEEELQMIGLGYDRMVRFMEKDDPNLRHPYDWYKYGEFGPYSWRGIVLGDPIRGGMSDECVTLIGEVRDHEEWEKIEQFELATEFGQRLKKMDSSVGFRHFWVFVRHPRWRISEMPWQQWTLACEVVLEAGKQRLDKWSLMARLGNKARQMITRCAAWMRPDIIYVKRPVYQCRFEPQDEFFEAMIPLLDPETEGNHMFELETDDGRVELCTYFGGLCKIARVNPKAFVDDVVKAYEKLSDEKKSKCLEFLLTNHPVPLLHPYTEEWKAKLEEMELGCDAPDSGDDNSNMSENIITEWIEDDDDDGGGGGDGNQGETESEVTDWMREDGDDGGNESEDVYDEDDDPDDAGADMEDSGDDELGINGEDTDEEEQEEKYWDEEYKKALRSNEAMENLVKRSAEISTKNYQRQLRAMEKKGGEESNTDGDELAMWGRKPKLSAEEWRYAGYGPNRRRIKKSKIPPELFLRAAVRPFTYKNLVKEIVLTRHAILEGEIGQKR
ncbi:uncharacterized protein LOC131151383 [Malania oleifera]|uniref:uncharacterized protein LOC131151383 n=1 Tax=Malania oleifera TaxID=397392 RepID=UPI0025AE6DB1|nr:uncharacterized protein LOC131151383 [Malania oleifera]